MLKRRRSVRGVTNEISNGSAGSRSYSVPGNSVAEPRGEADVDLVEVERRLPHVSIPLERAAPGGRVERGEARCREQRLIRLTEVETDVHDVAEGLRSRRRRADQIEADRAAAASPTHADTEFHRAGS